MFVFLTAAGVFTVALGLVHFVMPRLFDFEHAIPADGPALRPFRLGPYTYPTERSDVRGIALVMNHAVSFALVSIGVLDLVAAHWLDEPWAWMLAAWIAAWWFVRAGCQFFLGSRRGDLLIAAWFGALGALHACAAVRAAFPLHS